MHQRTILGKSSILSVTIIDIYTQYLNEFEDFFELQCIVMSEIKTNLFYFRN